MNRIMMLRRLGSGVRGVGALVATFALVCAPASSRAAVPAKRAAVKVPITKSSLPPATPVDTTMTLKGGTSGKEFRSMTIEGEDRVHVDFGRPELRLDLDPEDVPGLSRGTALDVL